MLSLLSEAMFDKPFRGGRVVLFDDDPGYTISTGEILGFNLWKRSLSNTEVSSWVVHSSFVIFENLAQLVRFHGMHIYKYIPTRFDNP